jgi:phage terminase large subunit GpA-like protein
MVEVLARAEPLRAAQLLERGDLLNCGVDVTADRRYVHVVVVLVEARG